ncbi:hypothetical protein ASG17_07960 [Brevundimonas sp. Leaf363]|uniref:hypothetical protein n=1 Tax=Brevundimonas sp. Leaf363 TaxID=1736353 RepID=UPI0006FE2346|nr:hypothetical protein [Brevundimonas sp. Leaf363]KQS55976.1 hypothetical protein ASG17_07960 [Brevundimonas sp. Leaf363]
MSIQRLTPVLAAILLAACQPEQPPAEPVSAPSEAPAIAGAPAGDFQTPEDLIRALYAEETIPVEPATIRRFFTEEFVTPLTPTEDGAVVDFDYRIDGQDGAAENLQVEEIAGGPTGGVVVTRFTNMGQAMQNTWTVCRQPDGRLRIVEATTQGPPAWSLRQLAGLPARAEGC